MDTHPTPPSESDTVPLSRRVYVAVADRKDTTPLDLSPLGAVINTTVIDALNAAPNVSTEVSFEYEGYSVHVTDGNVHLDPIST